jgi:two-component sensor histidine kinase
MKASLAEKEALLRELFHRSNNNMQVILALLDFQAMELDDESFSKAIRDTQGRIGAMALVCRKLYEANDLSRIDLRGYTIDLAQIISSCHKKRECPLKFLSEMEEVLVLIDSAIPCGLVLNELISNVYSHAYPSYCEGEVIFGLGKAPNGLITLSVRDHGKGVAPGFDPFKTARFGLQNVIGLVKTQLKGEVRFDTAEGFACEISFRDNLYAARV